MQFWLCRLFILKHWSLGLPSLCRLSELRSNVQIRVSYQNLWSFKIWKQGISFFFFLNHWQWMSTLQRKVKKKLQLSSWTNINEPEQKLISWGKNSQFNPQTHICSPHSRLLMMIMIGWLIFKPEQTPTIKFMSCLFDT